MVKKIGFGGGCHWCTEAVFQSLKGVKSVAQGWIASESPHDSLSEAVIVSFIPDKISLSDLTAIHLLTHKSTSEHSFRNKYRSAIYYFKPSDRLEIQTVLNEQQGFFEEEIITRVLPFKSFKKSEEQYQDYYLKNPEKPFCERYIHPKIELLKQKYSRHLV